ncbi:DUF5132 domain-containing protein [Aquabacterium sp. A7-Y]|uniref:DUF5132 domain-containing protein n=1 Tax=Aquabacterium sp. A7-Y TaxID=1349605 RepID=UPI00223CFF83|nr:DUF5132 domain-containing protein [Aquabacterium sp. A7-Y]MCW7538728.1 DUF5132 domain-containing protein [Aquabacterium sp. A7-Y]
MPKRSSSDESDSPEGPNNETTGHEGQDDSITEARATDIQAEQEISEPLSADGRERARDTRARRSATEPDDIAGNVGSVGTAVAVGVGAALIEAELIPGILIGAGAVLLGKMFPQVGQTLRPVVKTVMRAGLAVTDKAREMAAEAGEQVQDMVAEVQTERSERLRRPLPSTRTSVSHGSASHAASGE